MHKTNLLLIDDDKDFAESVAEMLASHGYMCAIATDKKQLNAVLKNEKFHIALIDIRFGRLNGIDLIAVLRESNPAIICVIVTAYAEIENSIAALRQGAYDFLRKPFHPEELLATLDRCLEKLQLEKALERSKNQLAQAQKMKTIGTLAGGVAHDFNNLLTPILGYSDLAIASLQESDPLYNDLQHILKAAHRAKELVEQILLFSRHVEKERHHLQLHLIIKEAIKLLRPGIPTTVEIRQRIDSSCNKVLADASQMHRVILNLATNAWQAMQEKGGILTLELQQVQVDREFADRHHDLKEGTYACLTVSDTGVGMPPEMVERIFEPFFTSKDLDQGTGLGLSVVHGIVRSHKGAIIVESEPGKGSHFHVYLPTIETEPVVPVESPQSITGGEETILIVDDEEAITLVLQRMLSELGYRVVILNDSQQTLNAFRKQPEKYDLVITDLTMPQMTGQVLAEKLTTIRPDIPIILMTGFGESITEEVKQRCGIKKVIAKPINFSQLAVEVRKSFGE